MSNSLKVKNTDAKIQQVDFLKYVQQKGQDFKAAV